MAGLETTPGLLKRAFIAFTAPRQQPTVQLESPHEDAHTRDLLFPNATLLYHADEQPYPLSTHPPTTATSAAAPHDAALLSEYDLDEKKDVRIIVAQDEVGGSSKLVLYDSKPASARASPSEPVSPLKNRQAAAAPPSPGGAINGHARRSSLASDSASVGRRSPAASAFQRTRTRTGSISSMPNIEEHANPKEPEYDEMAKTCLDILFPNVAMSYRGTSTSVKTVPLESKARDLSGSSPIEGHQFASFGRAEGRKRSNLVKSYTPSNLPTELSRSSPELHPMIKDWTRRRTVIITRTFSVAVPHDEAEALVPSHVDSARRDSTSEPPITFSAGMALPPKRSRPRRSPMYAIAIILQLPVSQSLSLGGPHNLGPSLNPRPPSAVLGHESLGSSLDSDRKGGWSLVEHGGTESHLSSSFNSDVDERVDALGQHWDVIYRTLGSLQVVVQRKIHERFRAIDTAALSPNTPESARAQPYRLANREPPVMLPSGGLSQDQDVTKAAKYAISRIVKGLKIRRVVTGQSRWPIWRDEAQQLGRWTGSKEENSFFYVLLTAFLGTHNNWLETMAPTWYRKQHREQQHAKSGDEIPIPSRTVIVSSDKLAARRLIFLLSAFLPRSPLHPYDSSSPGRPSSSSSLRNYSQSPPSLPGVSRHPSLRRTINRRGKAPVNGVPLLHSAKDAPLSNLENVPDVGEDGQQVTGSSRQSRRPSDTSSLRGKFVLSPLIDQREAPRNCTATTQVAHPDTAIPVAHITMQRTNSNGMIRARPGSSSSSASANLKHLQRSASGHSRTASTDSQNASGWGSLFSWSKDRSGSSTDQSDLYQTTDDGLGITGAGQRRPRNKLQAMVDEEDPDGRDHIEFVFPQDTPTQEDAPSKAATCAAQAIPQRPKPQIEAGLKLSVNSNDGIVDVDIDLPSFNSPLQSPLFPGARDSSLNSLDGFGSSLGRQPSLCYFSPFGSSDPQPVNVAGYLTEGFHPDFALQGTAPYAGLLNDVKRAMKAEPTPSAAKAHVTPADGPTDIWVDVCTSLIADTSTFTVRRLRLRRLVRLLPTTLPVAMTPGLQGLPAARSKYGDSLVGVPFAPMEIHLREEFDQDTVADTDDILIDAIDRILLKSGAHTPKQSNSSSRSSSQRGRPQRAWTDSSNASQPLGRAVNDGTSEQTETTTGAALDIPRTECKTIILGALQQSVSKALEERKRVEKARSVQAPIAANLASEGPRKDGPPHHVESTLEEGIRKWLQEAEEGAHAHA